jgi:hypothetical protein
MTRGLHIGLDLLQPLADHDEVGELFGSYLLLGIAGDAWRTHGGQHRLCLQRQLFLRCPGNSYLRLRWSPVDASDPKVAQFVTAVGEHFQEPLVTVSEAKPGSA